MTASNPEIEQLANQALDHLRQLLSLAQLSAQAERESIDRETVTLAVTGLDAGLLVGGHAQTLDALQYLLSLMTNKGGEHRIRINVDADGYRARRKETLEKFARDLAAQVLESGEEAVTDPLNAMDRRIVHTALADNPDIRTYSEGDDPNRYVVVSPAGSLDQS